jgi:hypothetical protein
MKLVENCNVVNLWSKPGCHVVSKAFSISKNTAAVDILLLKCRVTWSTSLIHCSVVLRRARKPNWLALSKFLSSICLYAISKITFSKTLPVKDKMLIGHKFWGNLGDFGKATTSASFQDVGKCDSRMHWLIRWVKWTSGLLGRCLGHQFHRPFCNFKEFSNFCKSQGLYSFRGSLSTASSRAWTLASTHRLWFSSHSSCGVNWFLTVRNCVGFIFWMIL